MRKITFYFNFEYVLLPLRYISQDNYRYEVNDDKDFLEYYSYWISLSTRDETNSIIRFQVGLTGSEDLTVNKTSYLIITCNDVDRKGRFMLI